MEFIRHNWCFKCGNYVTWKRIYPTKTNCYIPGNDVIGRVRYWNNRLGLTSIFQCMNAEDWTALVHEGSLPPLRDALLQGVIIPEEAEGQDHHSIANTYLRNAEGINAPLWSCVSCWKEQPPVFMYCKPECPPHGNMGVCQFCAIASRLSKDNILSRCPLCRKKVTITRRYFIII